MLLVVFSTSDTLEYCINYTKDDDYFNGEFFPSMVLHNIWSIRETLNVISYFLGLSKHYSCIHVKGDNDKTGYFISWISWTMNEKDMLVPHLNQVL